MSAGAPDGPEVTDTPEVTVLGSANLDEVLQVLRLPVPGETVLAVSRRQHPGGKGLNQAVAAARADARTAFVGALGRGPDAEVLLAALSEADVDTTAVARLDGPSGTAFIVVQRSGENSIVVDPGANAGLTTLSAAGRAAVTGARVLLAQLEVPLEVVQEAAAVARASGTLVLLNASPARPVDDLLPLVDVLLVNETEVAALGAAAAGREVVVTRGAAGAVHVGRDGRTSHVPGLPAEVVDTTGAGDTFAGVLAASLAQGRTMPDALRRAVAAGALAVEGHGAVPSIPTRSAVDARLAAVTVDLGPGAAV